MRKKIPLIGGIINLIESLKGDIGIIENTDVATHSISAGSYVIWHNELYTASSAISVDDALSSSNLTAVSGGVGNELNNNIIRREATFTREVAAGSANHFLVSDKIGAIPTGYTYLNIIPIITGTDSVSGAVFHYQGDNGLVDDNSVSIAIRNFAAATKTWTIRLIVYYIKSYGT